MASATASACAEPSKKRAADWLNTESIFRAFLNSRKIGGFGRCYSVLFCVCVSPEACVLSRLAIVRSVPRKTSVLNFESAVGLKSNFYHPPLFLSCVGVVVSQLPYLTNFCGRM